MKSFLKWLWTGFGTYNTGFRGIGMAICTLLSVLIAVYYAVAWIVKLVRKDKSQQPATE